MISSAAFQSVSKYAKHVNVFMCCSVVIGNECAEGGFVGGREEERADHGIST